MDIYVNDTYDPSDSHLLSEVSKIWHSGSVAKSSQVFMSGAGLEIPKELPLTASIGYIVDMAEMVAMSAAAITGLARPDLGGALAIGVQATDLGKRISGLISFITSNNTGAMLGLTYNTIMMVLMTHLTYMLSTMTSKVTDFANIGEGLQKPARKILSLIGSVSEILETAMMAVLMWINPSMAMVYLPMALAAGMTSFDWKGSKAAGIANVCMGMFTFFAGGLVEQASAFLTSGVDGKLPFSDLLSSVGLQFMGMISQALTTGTALLGAGILGVKNYVKDLKKENPGKSWESIRENISPSDLEKAASSQVQSVLQYSEKVMLMILLGLVSSYFWKSGMIWITADVISDAVADNN